MTTKEIFELRKQGHVEEAYEAARTLYAVDKGPYTSLAMFWTASDMLKKHLNEGSIDEAGKIYAAMERMLPHVPDKEGWVNHTFKKCQHYLKEERRAKDCNQKVHRICRQEYGAKN